MKTNNIFYRDNRIFKVTAAVALACGLLAASLAAQAQTAAANLSPDLQEIVKLAQVHMSDDVILAYVKNTGKSYTLSADDVLYLNSQSVSQPVISALLQAKGAPTAAPMVSAPAPAPSVPPPGAVPAVAPATPTMDYFQGQLGAYGYWMNVEGVGSCWVPAEASIPGWRPYLDNGHWEYTDAGWYWQSGYPWGEIAFHYGRWLRDERTGFMWAWAPGYDWAPSWVSWRYSDADGCLGWAPLPWDARFDPRLGIVFRGRVAVDMDFGMGPDFYVFIGRDHFWEPDYHAYVFAPDRARFFYAHSEVRNGFRAEHGHFVAEGIGRERMAQFTHHEVVAHDAHELRHAEEHHNLEVRRVAIREDHGRIEQGHENHERPDAGREGRSVEPREPGSANYENARGQGGQSREEPNAYNKPTSGGGKPGQPSSHGTAKPKPNEHGN